MSLETGPMQHRSGAAADIEDVNRAHDVSEIEAVARPPGIKDVVELCGLGI